jgi:hypothetical protein
MKNKKSNLKVTGLQSIPADYKGGPCILSMHIIDEAGGVYESDIHFDDGITADKLKEAMIMIFSSTDYVASEVIVKSFKHK